VVSEITDFGLGLGLDPIGSIPSPIRGAHGNEEFLVGFRVN
jgi:predicted rRNA methylase YqxC with S4 and FtsJ domains